MIYKLLIWWASFLSYRNTKIIKYGRGYGMSDRTLVRRLYPGAFGQWITKDKKRKTTQ